MCETGVRRMVRQDWYAAGMRPQRWEEAREEEEEPSSACRTAMGTTNSHSQWVQWRRLGLNVCMLGSAVAIAGVSGEPEVSEGVVHLDRKVVLVDTLGSFWSLCVTFIVGISTGLVLTRVSQKLQQQRQQQHQPLPLQEPLEWKGLRALSPVGSLKQFRLKEIVDMTDRFELELGRGGQGVVYFASLPDNRGSAAVKRLQKMKQKLKAESLVDEHDHKVMEREFWAELNTISRLHHRNLVALQGYCVEEDDLFLVYDFMAKGSLSQHLHPRKDGEGMVLEWKTRMRCAVEVAQGLEYLHSHANPSLVHRDIKSGNILFDESMNAKIADFGLSKPVISGQEPMVSKRLRGTHGYVDPVYVRNGKPCDKNDVYSYGIMLLELVTGRRAIQQKLSLLEWCKDFLDREDHVMRHILPRVVDSRMNPRDISFDQLFEVVKLARLCVQERQDSRPSMQGVVAALYNTSSLFASSEVPLNRFGNSGVFGRLGNCCSPSYDIKENSILVRCTVAGGTKLVLRCKIWPTPRNFGLNKVEASVNGRVVWKKGLWWYNAKSSREFTVGDGDGDGDNAAVVRVVADWHVTLRTNWDALPPHDPRRSQGPFCIEYLALKDHTGKPFVDYQGDKSPLCHPTQQGESRASGRESGGSGSGSSSSSEERRKSTHLPRLRRSSSPS